MGLRIWGDVHNRSGYPGCPDVPRHSGSRGQGDLEWSIFFPWISWDTWEVGSGDVYTMSLSLNIRDVPGQVGLAIWVVYLGILGGTCLGCPYLVGPLLDPFVWYFDGCTKY